MKRTLVVGGTGPTGPFIVNGLLQRGRQVTIFHRGTHEIPEIPDQVHHIHGDPHFIETIQAALAGHHFDEVIATYGRIRLIAEALAGKVERFISIGGVAAYRGFGNPRLLHPPGLATPVPENAPLAHDETEERFGLLIAQTEQAVLAYHPSGTVFRYPYVYGPYQLVPREWSIVRRLLDGRPHILLPDGGASLSTHGWAGNLAHAVLAAFDQPEVSAGKIYNCGDLQQLTVRQIVEVIAEALGRRIRTVSIPWEVAGPAKSLSLGGRYHQVMDLSMLRRDLGYTDVLASTEALARTARWYVDNRPDASYEERLGDPFDYEWEDRMVDHAAVALAGWQGLAGPARAPATASGEHPERSPGFRPHPYAHPKDVNEARDHRGR